MNGSTIENFLLRFRSTIFMRTVLSFMIASKPDVSAELVLDLLAFASLFPASQFENPYYFDNVLCCLPVCSCTKLSFLLRRTWGIFIFQLSVYRGIHFRFSHPSLECPVLTEHVANAKFLLLFVTHVMCSVSRAFDLYTF